MTFTTYALAGRVALISGGGSEIGFGIAKAFARAGIMSLMRTLRDEWGRDGILRDTIAPGEIGDTAGVKRIYEDTGRNRARSSTGVTVPASPTMLSRIVERLPEARVRPTRRNDTQKRIPT
ncbi:hypothetical protein LZA78_17225 [Sinirhodobacter sp. WL0062]|uniref:SDR family NAD(P)-dependent oxidoreductase n=1 Tax=Rhodobacter flavimaris TaxID=2907145 RepID=A0ABS8Z2K6_9RHOB|nr:hypothetical protein [Sinirhodobacter sp. WL0062]MCE5975212.1 hypothetical protein [Sinirhodobacter sp. WL0062]